ncbi:hypothetical protein TSOC_001320 [Tetrabaena socialis]|uniref:Uncharacterized protein n=1 Tax=Tetrabaena socialis TaxID=47790 RepID=A0A2J8AH39_9CHLO|nr:hypothetical protein TSOC_001320 [Tetrabaena socialis]|eukprot:PNH11821.1 hypothetical protein TSOC_001320 [Tetrabaena socialis]
MNNEVLGFRALLLVAAISFFGLAAADNATCSDGVVAALEEKCSSGANAPTYEALLASYSQQCVSSTRALRVLAPVAVQPWLGRQAVQFSGLHSQGTIDVKNVDYYLVPSIIDQQLSGLALQDLWIVDGGSLAELVDHNVTLALDGFIANDPAVDWGDFHPTWAAQSTYGNQIVAMPIDSDLFLMYWRRDVMEQWQQPMPATWTELAQLAAAWNARVLEAGGGDASAAAGANSSSPDGSGGGGGGNANASSLPQPRYGLCLNDARLCMHQPMLSVILASITQRGGPRTGWFVDLEAADPLTAVQLVNGSAMAAALEAYRALLAQSPTGLACQQTLGMFAEGACLFTINFGRQFKALQAAPVRGSVGISLPPGSALVLNRDTGALLPATPERCRQPARAGNGSSWACLAPMLVYGGTYGVISRFNDPSYQALAYRFLAYLTSSVAQWDGIFDASTDQEPVRSSMLGQRAVQMLSSVSGLWGYTNFDAADAAAYIAALQAGFASPNQAMEVNGPGSFVMRGLRVRMGVHSGLQSDSDVQLNRTANRMQYTGVGLQMAKAMCDCAHGGQILMSEAAFTQLAVESLKERVMVLHMGEHRYGSKGAQPRALTAPTAMAVAAVLREAAAAVAAGGGGGDPGGGAPVASLRHAEIPPAAVAGAGTGSGSWFRGPQPPAPGPAH